MSNQNDRDGQGDANGLVDRYQLYQTLLMLRKACDESLALMAFSDELATAHAGASDIAEIQPGMVDDIAGSIRNGAQASSPKEQLAQRLHQVNGAATGELLKVRLFAGRAGEIVTNMMRNAGAEK